MDEQNEKKWNLTKDKYQVTTLVTRPIYAELLKIIDSGEYLNMQEYLRDIIRLDFERREIKLG